MIGQTISHYAPKAHPPLADKILEKLGEGGMSEDCLQALFASSGNLQDPAERGESGRRAL